MSKDTSIGGKAAEFPETWWSRIVGARDSPDRARAVLEELFSTYWKPLYFHFRRRGLDVEAAKDAVQGLLARLLGQDFLARLDPAKGRLRSYLRMAADRHLATLHESRTRLKRGGGARPLSLDFDVAEEEVRAAPAGPLDPYDREWAVEVMGRAIAKLRADFDAGHFRGPVDVVLRHLGEVDPPAYAESAAACGKTVPQFKIFLHRVRERFRHLVRDEVARTVADEREVDGELDELVRVLSALARGGGSPPESIGGGAFELLDEIAHDDLGTAYRARDLRTGGSVAIRFLPEAARASPPEVESRLERELRALIGLRHPHIVGLIDAGADGDERYLVSELPEGRSLRRALPVATPLAVDVAIQIADALAHAHAKGFVHGDLRLDDIFVDTAGRARVARVGIAPLVALVRAPVRGHGAPAPRPEADVAGLVAALAGAVDVRKDCDLLPPALERLRAAPPASLDALRRQLAEAAAELRRPQPPPWRKA